MNAIFMAKINYSKIYSSDGMPPILAISDVCVVVSMDACGTSYWRYVPEMGLARWDYKGSFKTEHEAAC